MDFDGVVWMLDFKVVLTLDFPNKWKIHPGAGKMNSLAKVLVAQAWGPVCDTQHSCQKVGIEMCAHRPNTGEGKTGETLKLPGQPAKPNWQGPGPSERSCLKIQDRLFQRNNTPWVELWPQPMCTYVHPCEYTHNSGGESFPFKSIQVIVTAKQSTSKMKFVYPLLIIFF